MPRINIEMVARTIAFLRESPSCSEKYATITSRTEMVDVRAANASNRKNMKENTIPPGICQKMPGSTIEREEAPEAGEIPKANTQGILQCRLDLPPCV